jgi:hypothetical protein
VSYYVEVTIPAGTVGADLADFPVMVDLSDMPPSFWSGVRSDGGNIRAYASDGTTLIPHDVTFIDTAKSLGRVFVKTALAAATDTTIHIALLERSQTRLSAGNANGQYAVWSNYAMVVVFPDTTNRVDGSSATVAGADIATHEWKEISTAAYIAHQGVAFDGTYHYAVDTNALRKYSTGLTVVASNTNPCGDMNTATGETALNHCSSPAIIDGELWMPVEVYPTGTYNRQYVGRFSLADLSLIGYIHLTGATRESSAVLYDSAQDRLYVTDFTNGASIPYFDKTTGAYEGALALSVALDGLQGICELSGKYYVSGSNAGSEGVFEVQKNGTVNGQVVEQFYVGGIEGVTTYGGELILSDSSNTRHYSSATGREDWARIHGTPLGFTFPRSTVWTMAVSQQFTPSVVQQAMFGVYAESDQNNRHSGMYDAPTGIGLWNTTNGWRYPTTNVVPSNYGTYRAAFAQNDTAARKVVVNGTNVGESATSSARPTAGTNMIFAIAGGAGPESGYGHFQYAWARLQDMAGAWLAADAANMNAPASFYSIGAEHGSPPAAVQPPRPVVFICM